jgi:tyrosinase
MNSVTFNPPRVASSPPRPALRSSAILVLLAAAMAFTQGIRKNYTEMTPEEKNALVSAFQTLGDPPSGLLRNLATFHSVNFSANSGGIHQASQEQFNIFHAWHRYASFELEQEMQRINPHITLPYWDWTVNRLATDALWDNSFIGGFNARWSLGRVLGGGVVLPTAADVATVQSLTSFWGPGGLAGSGYSQQVENARPVHNPPHNWVGGVMAGGESPRDPIFWFHHNNVDRLWQLWEDQEPAVKSTHTRTTMARYDGTFVRPDGAVLPAVDPDAIVDSRSLGVFYAGGGVALLDNYTVANRTRNPEQFTYRDLIRAANFRVPAGRSANFRSATGIELQNGFVVESGGSFTAEVLGTGSIVAKMSSDMPIPQEPLEPGTAASADFRYRVAGGGALLALEFPGWIAKTEEIRAEVWNVAGKRASLRLVSVDGVYLIGGLTFDLSGIGTRGVHFFRVEAGKERFTGKVVLGGPK